MAVVLLNGTLNRVTVVELGVPAWLVSLMVSLPLVFAPLRALIGFRSDYHRSALGWRRVPYIWFGTLLQFGGLAIMPFALLLLSGQHQAPVWIGPTGAALAFLLVGAGLHVTQTAGLALATDLAPAEVRPRAVALLYVMLLLGMVGASIIFGQLLADFSYTRLVQVIQGAALVTMILNIVALWKQEARNPGRRARDQERPSFRESWHDYLSHGRSGRLLVAVALGTAGFSMQDILLEPYGGQVLHLSVGQTTSLTALLAGGTLIAFWLASRSLSRGADPYRISGMGALVGIVAFASVLFSAPLDSVTLFRIGTGPDRLRRRPVRRGDPDRRHGPEPTRREWSRPRRLGCRPGHRGRARHRLRRRPARPGCDPRRARCPWRCPHRPSGRLRRRLQYRNSVTLCDYGRHWATRRHLRGGPAATVIQLWLGRISRLALCPREEKPCPLPLSPVPLMLALLPSGPSGCSLLVSLSISERRISGKDTRWSRSAPSTSRSSDGRPCLNPRPSSCPMAKAPARRRVRRSRRPSMAHRPSRGRVHPWRRTAIQCSPASAPVPARSVMTCRT